MQKLLTMTLGHSVISKRKEEKNMTIHELANFSGISVRTLHYYDKIDLLKPCCIMENGYRKYNEDSLRRLQQIMFYKEMDLPLKIIKNIMNQPGFDQMEAIRDQKELLTAKRDRLTRMIEQMGQILEGNNSMDFSVFEHNELEEVVRSRIMQVDEYYRQSLIKKYGSIDGFISRMFANEEKLKETAIKYYGSVENYIESLRQAPLTKEGMGELQERLDGIVRQIADHKGKDVSDSEVQLLVDEWKEAVKKIAQTEDISELFRGIYHSYIENEAIIKINDETYGEGSSIYIGKAMEYNDSLSVTSK